MPIDPPDPVQWSAAPGVLAQIAADPRSAGESTCPMCGRTWTVTPARDCLLPVCGHFGSDTGPTNPYRPCEPCGLRHARTCPEVPRAHHD